MKRCSIYYMGEIPIIWTYLILGFGSCTLWPYPLEQINYVVTSSESLLF
jgi:hypothetical protein